MTHLLTVSTTDLRESLSARQCRGGSIAIGNFDGLHRGHLALLSTLQAKRLPRPWVVLTFEPHPRQFFSPEAEPFRLSNSEQKRRWLTEHKVDALLVVKFEQSLAALAPHKFVETFLVEGLEAHHIVVGENFVFGHKRQGTLATLRDFESRDVFRVHAVALQGCGNNLYTSSRAREAVREGNIDEARAVLGRSFEIEGFVQKGKGLGRQLGFPTANIDPANYCQPRFGVYDVSVVREQQRFNTPLNTPLNTSLDTSLDAVASFGERPTLGEGLSPLLELHFLDCSDRLYGERLRVSFERFQRPERHYESLAALQAQIAKDVALSQRYFASRVSSSARVSPSKTAGTAGDERAREDEKQLVASQPL